MVGNLIQIQFLAARDWPFGAALSFIVMAIVTGTAPGIRTMGNHQRSIRTGGLHMKRYNAAGILHTLHAWGVYAFIYAPILVLIVFSFNQERINAVWSGFTLDWYLKLVSDTDLMDSVLNSVIVGLSSTAIATILGTMAALAMHRYYFWGKKIMDAVLYLPIVIPEIVMAVSLLTFYVFIQLTLGLVSVIIAHVTFKYRLCICDCSGEAGRHGCSPGTCGRRSGRKRPGRYSAT